MASGPLRFSVYRTGDQTPIEISEAVHAYMDELAPTLPAGVQLTASRDRSEMYKDRLDLLLRNGALGLLLVMVTLGLFFGTQAGLLGVYGDSHLYYRLHPYPLLCRRQYQYDFHVRLYHHLGHCGG